MNSNHHTGVERKKTTLDRQKKQRHVSVYRFVEAIHLLQSTSRCGDLQRE